MLLPGLWRRHHTLEETMGLLTQTRVVRTQTAVPFPAAAAGTQLLLDAYPSAAIAYGYRKLRAAFSGSPVRLRGTDTTEADIGFSGNNFDLAGAAAFEVAHGGPATVAKWYDQSLNVYDAAQVTAASQAQYLASPLGTYWTGGSFLYDIDPGFDGAGAHIANRNFTLTAQIQISTAATFSRFVFGSTADSSIAWQLTAGSKLELDKQFAVQISTSTNALSDNVMQHIAVTYNDSGDWAEYLDGAANGSGNNLLGFTAVAHQIGNSNIHNIPFAGIVREMVVWPDTKTSGTVAAIKAGYY
jgi:Concanavalin A-like lectin/glucanases superfamily